MWVHCVHCTEMKSHVIAFQMCEMSDVRWSKLHLGAFWSVMLEASNDCAPVASRVDPFLPDAQYFLHLDLDAKKVVVMFLHGNEFQIWIGCNAIQVLPRSPFPGEKCVGSWETFSLNAPTSIPQGAIGHPCVYVGQKVLNRAAQIREKELDLGWSCI